MTSLYFTRGFLAFTLDGSFCHLNFVARLLYEMNLYSSTIALVLTLSSKASCCGSLYIYAAKVVVCAKMEWLYQRLMVSTISIIKKSSSMNDKLAFLDRLVNDPRFEMFSKGWSAVYTFLKETICKYPSKRCNCSTSTQ